MQAWMTMVCHVYMWEYGFWPTLIRNITWSCRTLQLIRYHQYSSQRNNLLPFVYYSFNFVGLLRFEGRRCQELEADARSYLWVKGLGYPWSGMCWELWKVLDPYLVKHLDHYGQDLSRVDTSLDVHVMQCAHVGYDIWHTLMHNITWSCR